MPTIKVDNQEIDVEQIMTDWALALMTQGVIVKQSISRWRAEMRLSNEMLGLKSIDDETSDFMSN